jgi:quercetin dioxygenase-like cupin family protein
MWVEVARSVRRQAMVRTGETIEYPLIGHEFRFFGDRFRILESARETDDGSLRGEYVARPRGSAPEHIHPGQEERFEVVSGTLGLRVGGRELVLSPGQSAVGPPGVSHKWWNPSDEEEVCFLVELRPGLGVETWLETLLGLARDGKTIGLVPKNPLQLAVLVHEAGSWGYVTGVLRPVQKALLAPVALLAFVGRLLGYRAFYPRYSGPEQTAEPAEPEEKRYRPEELLTLISVLWLLNSALGATVAIRESLPAEFAGMTRWRDPSSAFFKGSGTALSPGLPMMFMLTLFTALSTRGGKAGTVGVAGITALGAGGTIGVLGEPITYRSLAPKTFDPAKAAIASVATVLSALMALLGARRLLGSRRR